MDPDPDPDLEFLGPVARAKQALHGRRGLHGVDRALEDGEEIVSAEIDLAAAGARDRRALDVAHVREVAIAVAQAP